jgi:large conductance mechanosensitive channel
MIAYDLAILPSVKLQALQELPTTNSKLQTNLTFLSLNPQVMSFVSEFKEFIKRGNVVDLATGIVIGSAFGKISTSLVKDIVLPPLGILLGKVDFKDLKITLLHKTATQAAVTLNYGSFLQSIIDFIVIAIVIFICIRAYNKLNKKEEAKPDSTPLATPADIALLTEIRDLLKK